MSKRQTSRTTPPSRGCTSIQLRRNASSRSLGIRTKTSFACTGAMRLATLVAARPDPGAMRGHLPDVQDAAKGHPRHRSAIEPRRSASWTSHSRNAGGGISDFRRSAGGTDHCIAEQAAIFGHAEREYIDPSPPATFGRRTADDAMAPAKRAPSMWIANACARPIAASASSSALL